MSNVSSNNANQSNIPSQASMRLRAGSHNRILVWFLNSKVGRLWRILACGIAFFTFGLVSVLGLLTVTPILVVLQWVGVQQVFRITQRVISWWFRRFVGLMVCLGLMTYELHGVERLQQEGLLVITNHPTLIDTVFLIGLMKCPAVIVSGKYWRNPFTRVHLKSAGYLGNESPAILLRDCVETVRAGRSLLVFFEGTRSTPGSATRAQRGAAQIAIGAQAPFTPVFITCTPVALTKQKPWWWMPPVRPHFCFRMLDNMPTAEYVATAETDGSALAARRLSKVLEKKYDVLRGLTLDLSD